MRGSNAKGKLSKIEIGGGGFLSLTKLGEIQSRGVVS